MVWRTGGTGEPVVLLHGGAGSWTHWVRNMGTLARHHHVLVPDMPGFGGSDRVGLKDNIDPLAWALIQGIERLIGHQPFHLVGFSFGGLVAARIAALAKDRVRRLILVGASGFGLPTSLRLSLQSWRGLSEADQAAAHAHNLRVLMLTGKITVKTIRLQAANAQLARLNSRPWSNQPILRDTLADLKMPLGAIWGTSDAILNSDLEYRINILRRCDPACPVALIKGAGHWVAYDAPIRFTKALLPMLTSPFPPVTRPAVRSSLQ
ncbi:alpha/beta fold hydrolase [Pseudotabrizicola algicola]|uniref:Alpha/beta fold hydrolase n=1 Tax=Pseudotabrizicola algicola TaxID=2709381 RepID=A0A6B3RSW1_9RHOB|nr:alpha/beta fold hydrolase [Pseudotabrizicola algicola]NEX48621.1 alpha/beta fold hydrolase [Pseudotabrizicola algicola]